MWRTILASLESFSLEDLHQFKNRLEQLIQKKTREREDALDNRTGHRARVQIVGTAEIEREKEFFYQTHKITILEMSANGLLLMIPAAVIENDILAITFRSPSTGEKKFIDCQAMRVQKIPAAGGVEYEVAAKAVDKQAVYAYRDMLKNRGK